MLRDAAEHNLASFREKGEAWFDPTKEAITLEMQKFLYSLHGTCSTNHIRLASA